MKADHRRAVADVRTRIDELPATGEREHADYQELRSRLATVPPSARGRAWRKARILIDLSFRKRPGRAFKQLERMRQRAAERGSAARFDGFWSECVRVMAPYTLGPHGYDRALAHRDHQALWRELESVTAVLAAHGYQCFLNSGTLLGLVRDGSFIAYDDDVDLAVLLHRDDSPDAAGAAAEWLDLKKTLAAAGDLDLEFEATNPKHGRAASAGGLKIDLFPAWVGGDRFYVWPHTYGDLAVDDVLPLETRLVDGAEVCLPRRPEALLASNYGPDWRIPDPTFRFNWRAARQRFAGFIGHLGFPSEQPPEEPEA